MQVEIEGLTEDLEQNVGGAAHDLGESLESSLGAGLRWLSPIGLVRVDAAVALDLPGFPIRFHLNVGPDF